MNAKGFLALPALLSLALLYPAAVSAQGKKEKEKDEKVTLDQCPPAVQVTIQAEAAGGTIEEIEKETKGDVTTYEAEIAKDGREIEIKVAADGTLLKKKVKDGDKDEDKDEDKEENEKDEKITLDQCPAAVQVTIQAEAAGGTIEEIEKEVKGDVTTYEAEIKKDGKEIEIKVAADGTLLKKKVKDDKKQD